MSFSVIVDDPLAAGIDDLVNNVSIADDGANGADEDPTDNSDTDTDTIAAAPDLYITKDDGLAVVAAGDSVIYTINYGNDGSQGATGVVITETLPPVPRSTPPAARPVGPKRLPVAASMNSTSERWLPARRAASLSP